MGMTFEHVCPACGLRGAVAGGEDCGEIHTKTTIYCATCESLQDAVTCENYLANPPVRVEPRCNKSKRHPVRVWNREQPCPRCGQALLHIDASAIVTLWD